MSPVISALAPVARETVDAPSQSDNMNQINALLNASMSASPNVTIARPAPHVESTTVSTFKNIYEQGAQRISDVLSNAAGAGIPAGVALEMATIANNYATATGITAEQQAQLEQQKKREHSAIDQAIATAVPHDLKQLMDLKQAAQQELAAGLPRELYDLVATKLATLQPESSMVSEQTHQRAIQLSATIVEPWLENDLGLSAMVNQAQSTPPRRAMDAITAFTSTVSPELRTRALMTS